jgi:type IV pilus assembly protein PilB
LARALVQAGRLSAQQADTLQKKAAGDRTAFIDAIIADKAIDAASLAAFCAETFGYPLLDLSSSASSRCRPAPSTPS